MSSFDPTRLENEGMRFSSVFQPSKARTINNLQAAIDSFCTARNLTREYVAETLCGMSLANFSKLSHGQQGDFVAFVKEKVPAPIRDEFEDREQADRQHNPMISAAEAMVQAAFTMLRLSGVKPHMAHIEPQRKEGAA